jgi:signal transduction histidine kinase/HAMP domain-containing protein
MSRLGLRLRFGIAALLLVATTVTASVWTLAALSRLSRVVTDTVRESESVTAVTSQLAGALEREDDGVLLALAGDQRGRSVLAHERSVVDKAVADLFDVLGPADERELARPLQAELLAYRKAADEVITVAPERDALVQYHQKANPLLRRAVALTTVIRDRHFELARRVVTGARDQARASRRAVLLITITALGFALLVAWYLTTTVVGPLRRLTHGANAIREGRFDERIELVSRDELGDLASAFNQMAEDLAEFRRTNVGEVVRAKNTLEATLESLPDAVVLLDASCRILSMNRAALTTLQAAGVDGATSLRDLRIDGFDHAAVERAIRLGTQTPSAIDLTHTIPIDRDGSLHRLLPRVVPVPGSGAQPGGAILLLYDVTDLARVDEMRSELVAVASHELQTPLTTLRMTLLMLQETSELLPPRQRELVATSLIGVEQLTDTVHEFLDLTRIEAGQLRLNLEPVPVAALLGEVIRRAQHQADAQAVHLHTDVEPGLPSVVADQRRLQVVFDNIMSNALKYTPSGGDITVSSRRQASNGGPSPRSVLISVTDMGPGVPLGFRDRIFDKFFRLEHQQPEDRPRARGAGIGLYMCRQIVELHGGRIECTAGENGRGACIVVELPVGGSGDRPVQNYFTALASSVPGGGR